MGGNNIIKRAALATVTFGTSELIRAGGNIISHNVKGAKGVETFAEDPIHGIGKSLGRAFTPSSPDAPPALGTPIAPPRGQDPQEEAESRRRAFAARRTLGEGPRPSQQLTGSLG